MAHNRKLSKDRLPTKQHCTIGIIILTVILIIIFSVIWQFANQWVFSYGIVIDAGSTSSKIYLFKWIDFPTRLNGQVSEVIKCKASPGISDFVNNPSDAYQGIKLCLDGDLFPNIPGKQRNNTHVYLGATAGMRIIEKRNQKAIKEVFTKVGEYLLTTGLKLNPNMEEIKIISGSDEGINAWITANFLKGTIQNSQLNEMMGNSEPEKKETFGALDLGGASTQITFVPNSTATANSLKETKVRLYGTTYSVYSHSYLCYGKSEAENRLLSLLIKEIWPKVMDISVKELPALVHPCLLTGDTIEIPLNNVIQIPCVEGSYAQAQFGYNLTLPDFRRKANNIMKFVGSSDFTNCQILTDRLFDTVTCKYPQCTFNNIYRPPLAGQYLAFSGFTLIHRILKKTTDINVNTYDGFNQSAQNYCNRLAPTAEQQSNKNPTSEVFRKWRCFDFIYVLTLLKSFGFNQESFDRISFVSKIKDTSLGWSLGYMINKTSLIPIEMPLVNLPYRAFVPIMCVLSILLVVAIIFLLYLLLNKHAIPSDNEAQHRYNNRDDGSHVPLDERV